MKTFKEFINEETYLYSAFLLGRSSMPQIKDVDHFQEWIDVHAGVGSHLHMVRTSSINPTQVKFDQEKVDQIINNKSKYGSQTKPIIVSEDFFVLDGHHRYTADIQTGKKETWALHVQLPINKLLKLAYEYEQLQGD